MGLGGWAALGPPDHLTEKKKGPQTQRNTTKKQKLEEGKPHGFPTSKQTVTRPKPVNPSAVKPVLLEPGLTKEVVSTTLPLA